MIVGQSKMGNADFDLPESICSVLPDDPYEQLDVARRITAMAIVARVGKLEAEEKKASQKILERERTIYELQERLVEAERSLQETNARLGHALEEQAKMANEKNALMATVKKLNRDVAKLETFKRTLMQSLQEEDENSSTLENGDKHLLRSNMSSHALPSHDGRPFTRAQLVEASNAIVEDPEDAGSKQKFLSMTPSLTPKLTPTGSPRRQSTATSPRRHHPSNGIRSSFSLSLPASQATTAPSSPPHVGALPVRTPKVDGKEFFRQARNRLSYEQFSAFLANIKELNAHRQTREETLRKADNIFGPGNKDLYMSFEGLLSRHLPS
ncbi:uncharacterized protein At4g15545 isoform X1 [Selaginella moellendorffii]|nr:uncharacterized protein At4g15545 isoform X1 [Selaginella moellendorffii]|eukprot:XP_002974363.2 uncharacterized protein At4g15545 isoform X1 [Selaginella moellendorffii]